MRVEVTPPTASYDLDAFEPRMVEQLYNMECEQGSRFAIPGFSKEQLRQIWRR